MSVYCHDQYDHPLLWCDEKRRAVQRKIAEEGLNTVRNKQEIDKIQKLKERKEYREMVIKHCPWGRPGGGAPSENIRRGNILLEGLFPETNNDCRKYTIPEYRAAKCSMGGGGAPIRSASGRMLTIFRDDPIISFSDSTRKHVDINLRYRVSPQKKQIYRMQLDKIVAEKEKLKRNRRSVDVQHDPWGKAGPGGLPWRHPGNIGQSFMKSMGWTDKEQLKLIDMEIDKLTSSEENAVRPHQAYSSVQKPKTPPSSPPKPSLLLLEPIIKKDNKDNETKVIITNIKDDSTNNNADIYECCENCHCNCTAATGTVITTKINKKNGQSPNNYCNNSLTENEKKWINEKKLNNEKFKNKATNTNFLRYCERDIQRYPQMSRQQEIKFQQKGIMDCKPWGIRNCMITGGVELVPLLAKRRALQRPISLSTTDVTKLPVTNSINSTPAKRNSHLNALCLQIQQKERKNRIIKAIDMENSQKHFETLDGFWGRPGNGAPREIVNKLNLNDLLYRMKIK